MPDFVPLRLRSYFSLLEGINKPQDIARRCHKLGYSTCGLADRSSVSGSMQFMSALADKDIRPILGSDVNLSADDRVTVLARNQAGWGALLRATSFSHHPDHFKGKPLVDLAYLSEVGRGNLLAIGGYPGSALANVIFTDHAAAYAQSTLSGVGPLLREDRKSALRDEAARHVEAFGRENVFLALQVIDPSRNPAALLVAQAMRWLSGDMGLPLVADVDAYYPTRHDANDQRVLLATRLKTTLKQVEARQACGEPRAMEFRANWKSDCFHIPAVDEIESWHREAFKGEVVAEAIANTLLVTDMCERYEIRRPPALPAFACPDDADPDAYLRNLCRDAWRGKVDSRVDDGRHEEYTQRARRELRVIREAGLASYFLIVWDYCNWARQRGILLGGRGSVTGSLVSYLIGITTIDPIEHRLSFERFYNAGRNKPGHVSLPDIDVDFEVDERSRVVDYIKGKYGHEHVANIATFNSMKGRGAIKAVLRAHGFPFEEVNRITANVPKPELISEELQAMRERGDEPSVIRYALENDADAFRDWAHLNDDGTVGGELGGYFAQAMRLEGTKQNISMHAAGVIVSTRPLAETCPLAYDPEHKVFVAAMESPDLEAMGQVKLDVLGLAALSKIQGARSLLRTGTVHEE